MIEQFFTSGVLLSSFASDKTSKLLALQGGEEKFSLDVDPSMS